MKKSSHTKGQSPNLVTFSDQHIRRQSSKGPRDLLRKFKLMRYQFNAFILDDQLRTLSKSKKDIQLSSKMYHLLLLLINNAGHVIKKQQIYDQVWSGKIVSDSTLYKLIELLRNKLNDDKHNPQYIHTIHGEGYLFSDIIKVNDTATKPQKSIYWYLLLGLMCFALFSLFYANLTKSPIRFNQINTNVQLNSSSTNAIDKGLKIFINDLYANGLQNLKPLSSEYKSSKNKLTVAIALHETPKNNWKAQIDYLLNETNNLMSQKFSASNKKELLIELIDALKDNPLTFNIVNNSKKEFSENTEANVLHVFALEANQMGNYQQGKEYLLQALQKDENYLMAKFDLAISERNLSHLDQALAIVNSLFLVNNHLYFQMKISRLKGNILMNQNRLKETKEQYFLALELAKTLDLLTQQISLSINLGVLYKNLTQYDQSIKVLSQAINKMQQTKQQRYLGFAYSVLAETHNRINQIKDSISQTTLALSIFKEQENNAEQARNHLRLAWLYLCSLNDEMYVKDIEKAEQYYRQLNHNIGLENTLFIRFLHAINQQNNQLASTLLQEQKLISRELENSSSLMRLYQAQAIYAQHTEDLTMAFSYFKKYQELATAENLMYEQTMGLLYLLEIEILRNRKDSAKQLLENAMSKNIDELKEELFFRQGLYELYIEDNYLQASKYLSSAHQISIHKGQLLLASSIEPHLQMAVTHTTR